MFKPLLPGFLSLLLTVNDTVWRSDSEVTTLWRYTNMCIIIIITVTIRPIGWWRGSVVERRSLAGELSLSCARPAADG